MDIVSLSLSLCPSFEIFFQLFGWEKLLAEQRHDFLFVWK